MSWVVIMVGGSLSRGELRRCLPVRVLQSQEGRDRKLQQVEEFKLPNCRGEPARRVCTLPKLLGERHTVAEG